jgi:hypothetical protein
MISGSDPFSEQLCFLSYLGQGCSKISYCSFAEFLYMKLEKRIFLLGFFSPLNESYPLCYVLESTEDETLYWEKDSLVF